MGGWDARQNDFSLSVFGVPVFGSPGARRPGPALGGGSQAVGDTGPAWETSGRPDGVAPGRYHPPPTKVFRSRELEEGLAGLVRHKAECGVFPSDEELRARGRVVLGAERTAADEPALLERFKGVMEREVGVGAGAGTTGVGLGRVGSMMDPGAGLGSSGAGALGGLGVGGGGGLMMGMGMGLGAGMESMAGVGLDMDLAGDMDGALMQDMNFDFVFDTPDATMGPQ